MTTVHNKLFYKIGINFVFMSKFQNDASDGDKCVLSQSKVLLKRIIKFLFLIFKHLILVFH